MPNSLSSTGLILKTRAEYVSEFTAGYKTIYGNDINLDQDTPDGQMMNIYIQALLDLSDLVMQTYNSMDPDNAIGNVLDQRVAINGIQRQAGTFTVTNVTVQISQPVTLYGLDQDLQDVFTVADNAGNKWKLLASQSFPTPGSYVLAFQAELPGQVYTIPNTITVPVTIVLGVAAINNPTTYTTLGIAEETDGQLKIRRQKSVSLSSQGYLSGLIAALENISGVEDVIVYENITGSTDGDGVPGHSIWVIVSGTGSPASIASAIYNKRNAGCGLRGTQVYVITQADGSPFPIRWDNVEAEDLFIKFTATSLDGVNPPNIAAIKTGLLTLFKPGVAAQVNVNELASAVQAIDPNTLVTSAGFSLTSGGGYTNTLTPSAKNKQFAVSEANTIVLPIIVNPTSAAVLNLATKQFTSLGGYGAIVWSIFTNVSGGSINSGTGLYTAGAVDGTDVIRATDSLGNYTAASVVVT